MNGPLFRQMMKINMKGVFQYAFGSAFYILLMFWLYPGIADTSKALNEVVEAMPEGVAAAFNLQGGFGSMEAFISGEYYGLILPLLLSVFSLLTAVRLMARLVDQGSMAYLLSAPTTRGRVAVTQAVVLVLGLLLILAVTTGAGFLGNVWFIGDRYPFDGARFAALNAMAFLLFFAVAGLSFLVSACCDDEKRALGIAGAVTFGMFTLDLLGKLSDSVEWLRYVSAFSLFRPSDIVAGETNAWSALALAAIGVVGFAIGIAAFRRRDLPL